MKQAGNDGKQVSQYKLGLPRCEYAECAEELMMENEQRTVVVYIQVGKVEVTCNTHANEREILELFLDFKMKLYGYSSGIIKHDKV